MERIAIQIHPNKLKAFCAQNHIRRLSLFGSILNSNFQPESDVDVLVEFEDGHTPGFRFFYLQEKLSILFGRSVDLHTPNFLSPYFRNEVLNSAMVLYDAER